MKTYSMGDGRVTIVVKKIQGMPLVTMKLNQQNETGIKYVEFTPNR